MFGVEQGVKRAYFEQAIGSSQDPGTDWIMMFDSCTPEASNLAFVPARRGSMIAAPVLVVVMRVGHWRGGGERGNGLVFQRAWTIPMRRPVPSCCCASPGPLIGAIVFVNCFVRKSWV